MAIRQEWQDALAKACAEACAGKRDREILFEEGVILICLNELGGVEIELTKKDGPLFEELSEFCRGLSATASVIGTKGIVSAWTINFKTKGKR
jgi:hypothetical protein